MRCACRALPRSPTSASAQCKNPIRARVAYRNRRRLRYSTHTSSRSSTYNLKLRTDCLEWWVTALRSEFRGGRVLVLFHQSSATVHRKTKAQVFYWSAKKSPTGRWCLRELHPRQAVTRLSKLFAPPAATGVT